MNEVLALIDDLKNVKQKLVGGDTTGAIKLIDETIAYKEKEVKDFETWLENEHKLEASKEQPQVITSPKEESSPENNSETNVEKKSDTKDFTKKPKAMIGGTPILSNPIVLGGISKDHVNDVIKKNNNTIQGCHAKDKKTKGKVLIKFNIQADGAVSKAKIESTSLRDKTTEDCLSNTIKGLKFDPLIKGRIAIIRYPLVINF